MLLAWPCPAFARSDKTFDYGYEAVWSAAMRLIRADRGYKIRDKDKDNGYILFVHPGSGSVKECAASLEIVRATDEENRKKIRAQLAIEHQPSYVEVQFLDALEEKLHDEQGAPREPERPKKPPEEQPPEEQPPAKQPPAKQPSP